MWRTRLQQALRHVIPPLILGVLVVLIFSPLLKKEMLTTDDLEYHVARTANYYLALKQHQFPPRWAPNLNGGFGYPVFIFSYHLPYIVSTVLYVLLNNLQIAVNVGMLSALVAGTIGMYFVGTQKKLTVSESMLIASIYVFAPYSLLNVFARGAIGEIYFFAVLPWVLWLAEQSRSSSRIIHKSIYTVLLSLCIAVFFTTHQTSVMIALPIIVLLVCIQHVRHVRDIKALFISVGIPILLGTLMSMWTILPSIMEKQFINYNNQGIVENYWMQYPNPRTMFFQFVSNSAKEPTSHLVSIGLASLIVVCISIVLIRRRRLRSFRVITTLVGVFLFSVYMMTPFSLWVWEIASPLKYIQFPWRLLWVCVFSSAILCSFIFVEFRKSQFLYRLFCLALLTMISLSVFLYARPRGFFSNTDYEWFEYFKTASSYDEQMPIWSTRYTRHHISDKVIMRKTGDTLFPIKSSIPKSIGSYEILDWNGTTMTYVVRTDQPADVIQKTAYFPGWIARVDGKSVDISYTDEEFPGRVIISVPAGEHTVQVSFTNNTFAQKTGDMLTVAGMMGLALYLMLTSIAEKGSKKTILNGTY